MWTEGSICHFAKFYRKLPNSFGEIVIFWFLRWLPSTILDFKIFRFLVGSVLGTAGMHHLTKFYQNRSNVCRDIAFNNFQNGSCLLSWFLPHDTMLARCVMSLCVSLNWEACKCCWMIARGLEVSVDKDLCEIWMMSYWTGVTNAVGVGRVTFDK